jgi:hypothetical protein
LPQEKKPPLPALSPQQTVKDGKIAEFDKYEEVLNSMRQRAREKFVKLKMSSSATQRDRPPNRSSKLVPG